MSRLIDLYPQLLETWDANSNTVDLESLAVTSKEIVFWKCELGHSYSRRVRSEIRSGKCPICIGREVLVGFNDLQTVNPKLASEWDEELNDGLSPTMFTSGAKAIVFWRCNLGHSFKTQIAIRTQGVGCPACANQKVIPGFNDLATANPSLSNELDAEKSGFGPNEVTAKSGKRAFWTCSNGHSYRAVIYDRSVGAGCQICSDKKVLAGFNDLASQRPDLSAEFDLDGNEGKKPSDFTLRSSFTAQWVCKVGHKYRARVSARNSGTGCPVCAGQSVGKGYNDLLSQDPELASEWDHKANYPDRPEQVTKNSGKKFFWICKSGHSFPATVNLRRSGRGCPVCSGSSIQPGLNDLQTLFPEIAREWDPDGNDDLEPSTVAPKTSKKANWLCPNGHKYSSAISSRTLQGTGCPYCAGRSILKGHNDLATRRPDLAPLWDVSANLLSPQEVGIGSEESVFWNCPKGHQFMATIASMALDNKQCPYCSGRRAIQGFNDLATLRPDLAEEWDSSQVGNKGAGEVTLGSGFIAKWVCKNGHQYSAAIYSRVSGTGCPKCNFGGFRPDKPAKLYLIRNRKLGAMKIGITNLSAKTDRLQSYGPDWEAVYVHVCQFGEDAAILESEFLKWIRGQLKLPIFLSAEDMPPKTGGFSETFSADGVSAVSAIEKIKEQISALEVS